MRYRYLGRAYELINPIKNSFNFSNYYRLGFFKIRVRARLKLNKSVELSSEVDFQYEMKL